MPHKLTHPLTVLSLFDGIACGRQALKNFDVPVKAYYASEIDKHAIRVAQTNHPDIIQCGDIRALDVSSLPSIDLLLAGSPCQGFSSRGPGTGFDHPKSKLIFDLFRVIDATRPKSLLLENVVMSRKNAQFISDALRLSPRKINSNLLVPQSRPRLYWYNGPDANITPRKTTITDIREANPTERAIVNKNLLRYLIKRGETRLKRSYIAIDPDIAICLLASMYASWDGNYLFEGNLLRKLTPVECERLQGLPDHYTCAASTPQRYKMLGNAWTVPVIERILAKIFYWV